MECVVPHTSSAGLRRNGTGTYPLLSLYGVHFFSVFADNSTNSNQPNQNARRGPKPVQVKKSSCVRLVVCIGSLTCLGTVWIHDTTAAQRVDRMCTTVRGRPVLKRNLFHADIHRIVSYSSTGTCTRYLWVPERRRRRRCRLGTGPGARKSLWK